MLKFIIVKKIIWGIYEMKYFYYRLYIKTGFLHDDYSECVIKLNTPIESVSMFSLKIGLLFKYHCFIFSIYDYDPIAKEEYEHELIYLGVES